MSLLPTARLFGSLAAILLLLVGATSGLAQGNEVQAWCGSIAAGETAAGNSIMIEMENVTCGMPTEQVIQLVSMVISPDPAVRDEALEILRAQIPENSLLQAEAISSFLQTLGREEVPPERLKDTLVQIASENLALREQVQALEGNDPAITQLKQEALEALERGDRETAIQVFHQALELIRTRTEALLAGPKKQEAEFIALEAGAERTGLNLARAAELYDEAAETVAPYDADAALGYTRSAADAWYEHGRDKGDNAALQTAVQRWQQVIESTPRDERPLDWAAAQDSLGVALRILGQREDDANQLKEALAAFQLALEERTRSRVPLDWARTQTNLGDALRVLSQSEDDTAYLEEAVVAFRAALEELPRQRGPLEWAITQNSLGVALAILGGRETGTAHLEEAVVAFRAALEELPREREQHNWTLLDWATTQTNLGNTLRILGERTNDTARLQDAVNAFRLALEERTRERVPLDWAMTQANLGLALWALGIREASTTQLEEAVTAFHQALEEQIPTRVPIEWARTQNSLGMALQALGERIGNTAQLQDAVTAYRLALEKRTRERAPLDRAWTQYNLALTLEDLGHQSSDTAAFQEAARNFRDAAAVFSDANNPLANRAIEGAERAEVAYKAASGPTSENGVNSSQ